MEIDPNAKQDGEEGGLNFNLGGLLGGGENNQMQGMTEEMRNRVAEQKESVKKIHEILVVNSEDAYFANLAKEIKPLNDLYEQVTIETIMREPEMKEIDGQLVFIDNSETKIITPEGVVKDIVKESISLRNKLLK